MLFARTIKESTHEFEHETVYYDQFLEIFSAPVQVQSATEQCQSLPQWHCCWSASVCRFRLVLNMSSRAYSKKMKNYLKLV